MGNKVWHFPSSSITLKLKKCVSDNLPRGVHSLLMEHNVAGSL